MENPVESDLNDACQTIISGIMNGDRDPLEDAEQVEIMSDMDIEAVHKYRGYTVTLRWELYNAWHNSNGPMEEMNPFNVDISTATE